MRGARETGWKKQEQTSYIDLQISVDSQPPFIKRKRLESEEVKFAAELALRVEAERKVNIAS